MYKYADKLLALLKKLVRREFNRLGIFGFDELNVTRVTKETVEMFERLLAENNKRYLQAAVKACSDAKARVILAGYEDRPVAGPDEAWVAGFLGKSNFVSGYLYEPEAERKRLRLAEQMLTATEYQSRTQYNDSVRRSANLWWMQTAHYMLDAVDEATLETYEMMGVEKVEWHTNIDGRECKICRERNGKIYDIDQVPPKAHRGCRCRWEPVPKKTN
jgi:SPP1 gp7 family putative phage head morphogenesis protein